jgi:SAM-dependent methyltransferase
MLQDSSFKGQGSALAWISDVVRHRGIFGAVRHYTAAAIDFLRDLTPERRKSRYGDIDYDFDHSVDTTWANISLCTRFRELISGAKYQASDPELFHKILDSVTTSLNGFTFIDLGSGKGRTLLMASDYPFRQVVGVELLRELNEIAHKNIERYHSDQQKCFEIESICADARDFDFPDKPLVVYLFNPFPDYVLKAVLESLRKSAKMSPRDVYVVYHNLVHEDMFRAQGWLREMHRTHQFAIYRIVGSREAT